MSLLPRAINLDDATADTKGDRFASALTRWICFAVGLALLTSAMLIPAAEQRSIVEHQRDAALAAESVHLERLDNYRAALASIEAGDTDTIAMLAQADLNLVPESAAVITPAGPLDPMFFERLEPAPPSIAARPSPASKLERLVLSSQSRLWIIAGAALLTLLGLLPRAD